MKEIELVRTPGGLRGWTEEDQKAFERFMDRLGFEASGPGELEPGEVARIALIVPRNPKFHRKFFAMLKLGFDAWEPRRKNWKGLPVQKNFERFRKDATIAAGFYEIVATSAGGVKHEALSIAFGNMEEDEFERVYNAVADVLLQNVLRRYKRDDLDRVVEQLMAFT